MRGLFTGLIAMAAMLAGCHGTRSVSGEDGHRGRYAGVGLYGADHGWAHLAGAVEPADKAVARTADDTTVIVTVDGATGEIRQCGNYSGHCIAMNPWRGPLGPKQAEPVTLTARDEAVSNVVADAAGGDDNEVAPAKR